MKLELGVSREIITPKLGGYFLGYGSKKVSDSVHDDLTVTAITFSYGKLRSMLVSVCLCLVNNELSDKIRFECGKAAGVPASNVILSCTHTHSGPYTESFDGFPLDEEYINNILMPRSISAAKNSSLNMKSVKMGVASIDSRIGINRRQILSNNEVILGNNPWGPYDPELTVLSFKDDTDKTIANIVHVGAHCTAAGVITEVTRDWAGYMVDRLEAESGGVTAFVNGALGDVAPRMANGGSVGDLKLTAELGGFAGAEAVRAYKDIRVYLDEDMSVALGEICIPNDPLMSRECVNKMLNEYKAVPGFDSHRFIPGRIKKLEAVLHLHDNGEKGEDEFKFDQVLIRIGPVVFIPIPFEVSTDISMRLRELSKYGYTLILSCSNGSNSYLPTEDQICRGGYEIESFHWSRIRRLPNNTDWHMVSQNIDLMEKL